jgi:glycosyltransferase involved in cell wall biosynthesis
VEGEKNSVGVSKGGVSFISTFVGGEMDVRALLESLLLQRRLPDEVILVDGSSGSSTLNAVDEFERKAKHLGVKTLILKRPGCNIAEGRNTATERASFDVLVCSDAGCVLDETWLEEITAPFREDDVGVVAGTYRPVAESIWERATAAFLMPDPDRVAAEFPSARSIAYRKSVWKAVGGFPEELSHGEDTYFDLRVRSLGVRIVFAYNAVVTWKPRSDPFSFFRQILLYSIGDGMAGTSKVYYLRKFIITSVALVLIILQPSRPMLLPIILVLAGATLFLLYRRVPESNRTMGLLVLLLPVFAIHALGQVAGYTLGFLERVLLGKGPPAPDNVSSLEYHEDTPRHKQL